MSRFARSPRVTADRVITLRVTAEQHTSLQEIAARREVGISDVMREALDLWIETNEPTPNQGPAVETTSRPRRRKN